MDLGLAGKVAVVTGAGKGSGMAGERAGGGALGVAGSPSTDPLEGLERVTPVAVDLAAPGGPAELVARAVEEFGRVDVLVNNVGAVKIRTGGFLGTSDEEFEWAMQMNFFIALRTTRAALEVMVEAGSGAIVNIASVNAFFQPDAGTIDYGAAKAALVNLAKSLSQEFGPKGIRVNSVSPGPVATDLWLGEHGVAQTVAAATGTDASTAREPVIAGIGGFATGKFTEPGEVAAIVAFLASPRSANVTGANYLIDGGLIKTTSPRSVEISSPPCSSQGTKRPLSRCRTRTGTRSSSRTSKARPSSSTSTRGRIRRGVPPRPVASAIGATSTRSSARR